MTAMNRMLFLLVATGLLVPLAAGSFLERRPGYGIYYGIAKLSGARLDVGPVNFAELTRRATPNDALVCPPGRCPHAETDWEANTYDIPPSALIKHLTTIVEAEPNVGPLFCFECDTRARFIQYSRIMHFPDTIDVEAFPVGEGQSTIAIYSRSLLGRGDFGVNHARVARWMAALAQLRASAVSIRLQLVFE
jgi:uncharacterized protein (DUF1499 family)